MPERPAIFGSFFPLSAAGFVTYRGGEGEYLFTSDGRRILDGWSGSMNANLGHGNAAVARCLAEQATSLSALNAEGGEIAEASIQLAARLRDLLRPQVFATTFCSSGSLGLT